MTSHDAPGAAHGTAQWVSQTLTIAYWEEHAGDYHAWIAGVREVFIVAQGRTKEQARTALQRTIVGNVTLELQRGDEPFRFVQRTPLPPDLERHFTEAAETLMIVVQKAEAR